MKVRIKMHLINAAVLLAVALIVIISAKFIMLDRFVSIEEGIARANASSAKDLILQQIDSVNSMTSDWAFWDETYEYAASPDQGYLERNLTAESLSTISIDIITVFNSEGEPIISRGNNSWEGEPAPVPEGWIEALKSHPGLFTPPNYTTGVAGIVLLPEYPVMVSACQIITSQRKGPTHGTLVMGRKMDAPRIAAWEKILRNPLKLYIEGAKDLPPQAREAMANLLTEGETHTISEGQDSMAGYAALKNISGDRELLIESRMPRIIYAQARDAMRYFAIAALLMGIVLWLAASVITERALLKRLLKLEDEVEGVTLTGEEDAKVEISGDDEIGSLGGSINEMIAALHRSRLEVEQANKGLERANATKTEFTSIVSHELRTPLGTIKQAIELVQDGIDGPISDKQRSRLDVARRNVDRLVRLTNELLDFTRLETGRVEMHYENADVGEMLGEVYHLMKPAADAKGVALIFNAPAEQRNIVCDADKIKQTVINLISNATKFTDSGGRITMSSEPLAEGVRIDVEDTGRGVKDEDLPRLFEPFRQIKDGKASGSEGSGLGLSICKLMVEKHGGRIEVMSKFGEGTRFSVVLPEKPPETA